MQLSISATLSLLALVFTVLSFWWMNWRPGRLRVGNLTHFAVGKATEGSADEPNVIIISLPLILFNSGARPLIVESLRLVADDDMGILDYEAVDSHIGITPPNETYSRDHFFLPVSLRPNEVIRKNFVFERRTTNFTYGNRLYHLHLEAKVSQRRDWMKLNNLELDLRDEKIFSTITLNVGYRAFKRKLSGPGESRVGARMDARGWYWVSSA